MSSGIYQCQVQGILLQRIFSEETFTLICLQNHSHCHHISDNISHNLTMPSVIQLTLFIHNDLQILLRNRLAAHQ